MSKISINNELLISYNKKGIFPHPKELKESFLNKIDKISLNSSKSVKENFSFQKLKDLFDISPCWAKIEFTKKGLHFWEAAALEVNGSEYHLKLNSRFKHKRAYFGLYDKNEVLMHELAHLGRKDFNEPKYEEMFAYQTSKGLRRLLGPLFQSPIESLLLLTMLILSMGSDLTLTSTPLWLFVKSVPLLYLLFLSSRLFSKHTSFHRCQRKLTGITKHPSSVLPLMYRLSDAEIDFFSKKPIGKIKAYIEEQNELRWTLLKEAYLA